MKTRGFEEVIDQHKQYGEELVAHGKTQTIYPDTLLPVRADARSAGYDFFSPVDIKVLPGHKTLLWTNVKAYMGDHEVLHIYPRSSMGIKKGLMLSNTVGIIDASYYSNEGNDGNIGLSLLNTSQKTIEIKRGERIAQGVFSAYLVADQDDVLKATRTGGMGSSDK